MVQVPGQEAAVEYLQLFNVQDKSLKTDMTRVESLKVETLTQAPRPGDPESSGLPDEEYLL